MRHPILATRALAFVKQALTLDILPSALAGLAPFIVSIELATGGEELAGVLKDLIMGAAVLLVKFAAIDHGMCHSCVAVTAMVQKGLCALTAMRQQQQLQSQARTRQ
jgi:hypothetical protein